PFLLDCVRAATAVRPALNPQHPRYPPAQKADRYCRNRAITRDILRARLGSVKTLRFAAIPHSGTSVLTERSIEPMDCSYVMARRTLDKDHPKSEQMHPDQFPSSSPSPPLSNVRVHTEHIAAQKAQPTSSMRRSSPITRRRC